MSGYRALFDRVLVRVDAEKAHRAGFAALRLARPGLDRLDRAKRRERVPVKAMGIEFPGPLGLAAGFDKNAEGIDALAALGFSFVEVGTVTGEPQPGNDRPRLFRLPKDRAVVNRMGFNNDGAETIAERLAARRLRRHRSDVVLGVNIGKTKAVPESDLDAVTADYEKSTRLLAPYADYLVVNVSSPNTPGLRDLQQAKALDELLARVLDARERNRFRAGVMPVLLKIAPDVTLSDLDDIVGVARRRRVDGMIVGNTTVSRPTALRERERASEQGGLSGRPLFRLSTRMLAETFVRAENAFPLVGAGGIDSGATAIAKIKAGATLLQLYTGMVYRGIGVVNEIKADLAAALRRGYRNSLASMIGSDSAGITAESWPG